MDRITWEYRRNFNKMYHCALEFILAQDCIIILICDGYLKKESSHLKWNGNDKALKSMQ